MLLFKRTFLSSWNISYCRICARVFSERHSKLESETTEKKDDSDTLFNKYEEKLQYNSFIESLRLRYGYKKNAQIMSNRLRFNEHIQTTLQTIQPLPVSLKYCMEDSNTLSIKPSNEKHTCNTEDNKEEVNVTKFPYNANIKIEVVESTSSEPEPHLIKREIIAKKKFLDESKENWLTHYENYEQDLALNNKNETDIDESRDLRMNYGTPDPYCHSSNQPCGGCGAYLHCKDTAIPGYIPSEIFKNCFRPGGSTLRSILCQRCHFLNEYNIALQVQVSPDDYPEVLKTIFSNFALPILMVDLTDFPCSIWPGIADILGPKTPIVVVGNKVDLIPKDHPKFLKRVKEVLTENLKLSGFATANIRHIELISAKTGYGVENLISSLQKVWRRRGDVYLIGCTNVGKSSLFNLLLQSDFCKIQAANLVQRATTSPWPGTTLNLLKFPISRFDGYRLFVRQKRLEELQKIETDQQKRNEETLKTHNNADFATLIGRVERSIEHLPPLKETSDNFSIRGSRNLLGRTMMGINEKMPEFAAGKWCYDTPGVVHPDQILHLLTTDELVKTLPKELIRPETYCVEPGTSLFIAGLARLDYVQGPNSVRLTVFRANSLPITVCNMNEAESIYNELLGTELFGVPILKGDRAQTWPGLKLAKNFRVFGKNVKESSYDVVLSSAGWIAINCRLAHYEFNAWTPEKRGVYIRDSLVPKAVTLRGPRIRHSVAYKKHKFI